jgi:hypothetical protein
MRDLLRLPSSQAVTTSLFASPHQQFFDNNGKPLAGGKLYAYDAGTTTYTNTWQDAASSEVNTNPIVLDGGGFATVWLDTTKAYRFRMTNAQGVQQWTVDGYQGALLASNILVPINYLLPATGGNDINNGSQTQTWRWSLTGASPVSGLAITEAGPSTTTGAESSLLDISTLAGSTAQPLRVVAQAVGTNTGSGLQVMPNGDLQMVGGANIFSNVTGSAPQNLEALADGQIVGTGFRFGPDNFIDDEPVAGSGNNWTLAQIPSPPTSLQLYQQISGFGSILLVAATDYQIAGASITTVNSIGAGLLKAWYRF